MTRTLLKKEVRQNLNFNRMKKLILGLTGMGIALVLVFAACQKDEMAKDTLQSKVVTNDTSDNYTEKDSGVEVTVPFEPIRIHRGTTDRNRDGKNCGCDECFGLCNAPLITDPDGNSNKHESYIAIETINTSEAYIYFLNQKPFNFEEEFGIDEPVKVILNKNRSIYFEEGLYNAQYEEGTVYNQFTNKSIKYFGKVKVRFRS